MKPVNSVTSRTGASEGVDDEAPGLATTLFWFGLGAGATSAGGDSPQPATTVSTAPQVTNKTQLRISAIA
ncbi:hypothetical protein AU192_02515 [Mycobacterium lehmannii]|uniref:Uncharacterized protein n=1 Tax=Mycobacterium lehmannii TaxID=2048550 RepID=A0A101A8U4_9MYCO|nr:hypothetical protein AU192_02515 [Mycobacterium lehmannii]